MLLFKFTHKTKTHSKSNRGLGAKLLQNVIYNKEVTIIFHQALVMYISMFDKAVTSVLH